MLSGSADMRVHAVHTSAVFPAVLCASQIRLRARAARCHQAPSDCDAVTDLRLPVRPWEASQAAMALSHSSPETDDPLTPPRRHGVPIAFDEPAKLVSDWLDGLSLAAADTDERDRLAGLTVADAARGAALRVRCSVTDRLERLEESVAAQAARNEELSTAQAARYEALERSHATKAAAGAYHAVRD